MGVGYIRTRTVLLIAAVSLSLLAGCEWPQPTPPRVLDVPLVRQETEVWCWAATSEMIFRYYGSGLSQCEILSRWVGQDCCLFRGNPICFQAAPSLATIRQTLVAFGGLSSVEVSRPLSLDEIKEEIEADRPIIAAYANTFSGHVVVIYGYDAQGNVYIRDPYFGSFTVPYGATFVYGGDKIWSQTIYRIRFDSFQDEAEPVQEVLKPSNGDLAVDPVRQ
ncbi:MAG: C39 family peptidase [Candidatus Dadabacteria bacterium]|nr:C39 family peptidase [Candidatus Dadabacteria bacterium]